MKKQSELERRDETGNVHDEFFTLRYEVVKGEKKVDTFLREAIDLLKGILKILYLLQHLRII